MEVRAFQRERTYAFGGQPCRGATCAVGWCGSTASRDRTCEGLVHKSTLGKEDRQGERWKEIRRVLPHTLKASRHRRRLRLPMSEVSRVRKADFVAYHVQCPLEVSATARRRIIMLDAKLRSLHVVTLMRAPCGRVHHSQVSYLCSA